MKRNAQVSQALTSSPSRRTNVALSFSFPITNAAARRSIRIECRTLKTGHEGTLAALAVEIARPGTYQKKEDLQNPRSGCFADDPQEHDDDGTAS